MTAFRFFIFVVLLSLLIPGVLADFSAVGTAQFKTCSCAPMQSTVNVQNTGSSVAQVNLKPSGEHGSWVTLVPSSILLLPGEQKAVAQFINADCSAHGVFDVGVDFESDGQFKQMRQKISLVQCSKNQSAQPVSVASETGIFQMLLYSSVALTILLVLIFVAMFVRYSQTSPRIVRKIVEVEPVVVKRALRYPWESQFRSRPSKVEKAVLETSQKKQDPLIVLLILIFVIIAVIAIVWFIWFLSQPATIIIPGNGSNITLNLSNKITGI